MEELRDTNIRVRFAPSPTGDVHIGGIWIAQFNWFFARQHGGKFIVRVEDTDQKRMVIGSVEKLYEALDWYGLTPDEGPEHGGSYGPYIQSQRLKIYDRYAVQLIEQGSAYYCFCSPIRLEELRLAQQIAKLPPRYDKHCATIPIAEAKTRVTAGESHVIRLHVPTTGAITLTDLIRGQVTFRYDQIDDSVLQKSDGFPTYHLAVVVDDHLMEISHVLRAEEWLPSTPKHLLLYQALGWEPPQFAHLPQILGPHKKKLSKRDGSASALHFRDQGYLPETMQNFLALMGWHPKGNKEILSRQEMIQQFRITDINPSGAIFDQQKLDWLNGSYIRTMEIPQLFDQVKSFWKIPPEVVNDRSRLFQALSLIRERMKTLPDVNLINTVFPVAWDEQRESFDLNQLVPVKGSLPATKHHLEKTLTWLEKYSGPWQAKIIKVKMLVAIATAGKKNGEILWPLRVALSLQTASPDVFDLLEVLGQEESLRRIRSFG